MIPDRSRISRCSDNRFIAAAVIHFAHKSCAVKRHAYTLDSSANLASALQQNMLFPTAPWESFCFRSASMIRAVRQPTDVSTPLPVIESDAQT
jgi:hypothetical protein